MFDSYIGNERAISRLKKWVNSGSDNGVILQGPRGLKLLELAKETACQVLHTDKLDNHPDFIMLDGEHCKLGVEEASMIINKAMYVPSKARINVALINCFEKMTVAAQNKLLKTIEDATPILIIAVAYTDGFLDTIQSRLSLIKFSPLLRDDFNKAYAGENKALAYILSKGCPYAIDDKSVAFYKPVAEAIEYGEERELLKILNLVKEKDTESFFTKRRDEVSLLLNILEKSYMDVLRFIVIGEEGDLVKPQCVQDKDKVIKKINSIQREKNICKSVSYTKDDFFLFMVTLIEGGII